LIVIVLKGAVAKLKSNAFFLVLIYKIIVAKYNSFVIQLFQEGYYDRC